jgi:hypothetical protein
MFEVLKPPDAVAAFTELVTSSPGFVQSKPEVSLLDTVRLTSAM